MCVCHFAQPFEVVYVSLDTDAKTYRDVVRSSPWPAMLQSDEDRRSAIIQQFETLEVPCLVILDKDGNLLNRAALGPVLSNPDDYPWRTQVS